MENTEIKFKKGDWVKMQITSISDSPTEECPVECGNELTFTTDGKYFPEDKTPVIFPLEEPTFKERWMMVSVDGKNWIKRKVILQKNGVYVSWSEAVTDEEAQDVYMTSVWEYAKEIEEEQPLTLEERVKRLEEMVGFPK